MASNSYLPAKDEDFNSWAQNFSSLITATPVAFGLVAGDATTLAGLVTTFSADLAACLNPPTRTPVTVAAKNTARAILTADIRALAKRIQATATVTAAQKTSLGLTVPDHVPTPITPPHTKPVLSTVANGGQTVTLRLVDETTPLKRAKPVGVEGSEFFSWVGAATDTPPADLESWRYEGQARRSDFAINYNAGDVTKIAHIKARWFNPRGQTGPLSDPITLMIAA